MPVPAVKLTVPSGRGRRRADHAPLGEGQDAADLEAAEVARPPADHQLDRAAAPDICLRRLVRRLPAHHGLPLEQFIIERPAS